MVTLSSCSVLVARRLTLCGIYVATLYHDGIEVLVARRLTLCGIEYTEIAVYKTAVVLVARRLTLCGIPKH